ncbi:MAG: PhzF family phenazine biosynthesis protein [Naasia sp.]|nr:PhzF family phenazine biosynthesis protein [Naasia sp.]
MLPRRFAQIDVFSSEPCRGNPVAVVIDADDLDDAAMQAFARWTNLSETTFLLPPTTAEADYRLRIFTPGGELPFAGHPTLGSCAAWLGAGGRPRTADRIVQECGIGLVELRRDGGSLAFAAPPLIRSGEPTGDELAAAVRALGVDPGAVRAGQWVDNGPGWLALLLDSAATVLALRPDFAAMGSLKLGVVAPSPAEGDSDFEVRAFVPGIGVPEDPVTGSLNAGLATWFLGAGIASGPYVAAQGTVLGRAGRVRVTPAGGAIWIGGATSTVISGTVLL